MDNAMSDEASPEDSPFETVDFMDWFDAMIGEFIFQGMLKSKIPPSSDTMRWYFMLEGARDLQKNYPGLIERIACAMPPVPQPWPYSRSLDYCESMVVLLYGGRRYLPYERSSDLIADLRSRADRLIALADKLGRRRKSHWPGASGAAIK